MPIFGWVIGVDEVGRGPLAGPLAIGLVKLPFNTHSKLKKIPDSKKLSVKKREEFYNQILNDVEKGRLEYKVVYVSQKTIDNKGMSYALKRGVSKGLEAIKPEIRKTLILMDGGLRAPDKYCHQKTVIKGDEKIPVIALSSILAKVERDRKMISHSKKYPCYDFEFNKGYGTKNHIKALLKNGPCQIHRKTFLSKLAKLKKG